ncbi:MAG: Ig-like domain-containing protein, partial [Acidimicrobiia bacterium]
DVDIDGPQPGDPAWNGTVQIIEHDEALGAAAVVGDLLTFTPAEGVVGDVVIRYAVCEDPSQQDNPYVDDPNTLPNEGLPFCGVGTVVITVVGNEAPLAVDDPVALAAGELVQGIDLAANDVDPEGGVLSCVPGPLDLQPAGLAQATVDAACQLQVQAQPGVVGQATAPYTVCDDHVLSVPAYPAAPYGTDGRDPGDPAPRCAQALVIVDVAEVAPPPEDPDATCQQDCVEEDPPADDGDGDGGDDGGDDVLGGGYGRPGGQVGRSSWASTGSRGSLPRTGGPAAAPALVGAGLLAAGAVVLVVRRRVASVARRS